MGFRSNRRIDWLVLAALFCPNGAAFHSWPIPPRRVSLPREIDRLTALVSIRCRRQTSGSSRWPLHRLPLPADRPRPSGPGLSRTAGPACLLRRHVRSSSCPIPFRPHQGTESDRAAAGVRLRILTFPFPFPSFFRQPFRGLPVIPFPSRENSWMMGTPKKRIHAQRNH